MGFYLLSLSWSFSSAYLGFEILLRIHTIWFVVIWTLDSTFHLSRHETVPKAEIDKLCLILTKWIFLIFSYRNLAARIFQINFHINFWLNCRALNKKKFVVRTWTVCDFHFIFITRHFSWKKEDMDDYQNQLVHSETSWKLIK